MKKIVLTSNGYVNVLPGFAYLFNKFYPNQEVTIVRYDIRPPKLPENFKQFAIGNQSDYSWSGGLRYYLELIDDEFVMLMLEDYYLDNNVRADLIQSFESLMIENKEIVKIDLTDDRLKVDCNSSEKYYIKQYNSEVDSTDIYMFVESSINAPFLASVQTAIWRRDFLIAILNNKDNAWQFEKNKRTKKYLEDNKAVILGTSVTPMHYINAVGGEGNKPGEYDLKKMPDWMIKELKENRVYNG